MFGRKKAVKGIPYDKETEVPAIKTSICTGEKVAGFQNIASKQFRDVALIRDKEDLLDFCEACGVKVSELKSIV